MVRRGGDQRVLDWIPDSAGKQSGPIAKLEVDFGNWTGRLK